MYGNVLTMNDGAASDAGAGAERREPGTGGEAPAGATPDGQWSLWEVFTQEEQGAPHEHAGSVRATDAEHALQNARDVYGRRGKVISMWVVPTTAIVASTPEDAGPFYEPGNDKPYRHPHFYKPPRGVRAL